MKAARRHSMVPIPNVHDLYTRSCPHRPHSRTNQRHRAQGASPRARGPPMDYPKKLPPNPWCAIALPGR